MATGYRSDFIGDGIFIPLPGLDTKLQASVLKRPQKLRDAIYSDHQNFTLVMNKHTRQVIYSAHNINQALFRDGVSGEKSWSLDGAVGAENQLDNKYYEARTSPSGDTIPNPYDRGHMVMRYNNVWGGNDDEADRGGKATFIYTNASLQHENLNRDEWRELELKIVRTLMHDSNDRLTIFTGPVYGDLDRNIYLSDTDSARVPSGFFKVICFRLKGGTGPEKLGVYAFAIFQDATVLQDLKGRKTVKTNRNYQVTITELQQLTGIDFGEDLYNRNPLFYTDTGPRRQDNNVNTFPERIPLNGATNMVVNQNEIRCDLTILAQRRIIIASAMINPIGNEATGEWISLHNLGSEPVDLGNWKLADNKQRQTILAGTLEPGTSIRLSADMLGTIKLTNTGGGLMLHDTGQNNCVIDFVSWSRQDVAKLDEGVALVFGDG